MVHYKAVFTKNPIEEYVKGSSPRMYANTNASQFAHQEEDKLKDTPSMAHSQ